jgi:hypothetical protein
MQPGEGALDQRGHSSEVRNLAGTSPRIQLEASALTLGVDDGEISEGRQVAPPARVLLRLDAAAVRRDDERKWGIATWSVPAR